jgi:hypothetical protein
MARINMHAQEVADGRLTLREAIAALGADLCLYLPKPGEPEKVAVSGSSIDAGVRIETTLFDPLLVAVSQAASRNRAAIATVALQRRLEEWGVFPDEARSILRHDIRCLRALGASLSHGPIDVDTAHDVVALEGLAPLVDAAGQAIAAELLESLAGPKRMPVETKTTSESEIMSEKGLGTQDPAHGSRRMSFLRRILSALLGRRQS